MYYEKVINEGDDEEGHSYTFARIHIGSLKSETLLREQFFTLDGEPKQHFFQRYSDFNFNQHDSIFYLYPEGLKTIANADIGKKRESEALKPGDLFPIFDLIDADGVAYSSESVLGKKAVFVFSFIRMRRL